MYFKKISYDQKNTVQLPEQDSDRRKTNNYNGIEDTRDYNPERKKEMKIRSVQQYINDILFGSNGLQYFFANAEKAINNFPNSISVLNYIQEQMYGFLQGLLNPDFIEKNLEYYQIPYKDGDFDAGPEDETRKIKKANIEIPEDVQTLFNNIRKILKNLMRPESADNFSKKFEDTFVQVYSQEFQNSSVKVATINIGQMKAKIAAKYKGKEVKLNKPTSGDVKKFKVFVQNDKGNVVKVNFGDPNMEIKRDNPDRKKNFRARHNCDNPGPKTKARYWSCKMWSDTPVSDIVSFNMRDLKKQ